MGKGGEGLNWWGGEREANVRSLDRTLYISITTYIIATLLGMFILFVASIPVVPASNCAKYGKQIAMNAALLFLALIYLLPSVISFALTLRPAVVSSLDSSRLRINSSRDLPRLCVSPGSDISTNDDIVDNIVDDSVISVDFKSSTSSVDVKLTLLSINITSTMLQSLLPLKQVNKLRDDQVEGIVELLVRQHGREEARAIVVKNPSILLTKGEGGWGGMKVSLVLTYVSGPCMRYASVASFNPLPPPPFAPESSRFQLPNVPPPNPLPPVTRSFTFRNI